MNSILMATDLSNRAKRALGRAVMLAADSGARLTVVHVMDEDLAKPVADAHRAGAEQTIRDQLGAAAGAGLAQDRVSVEIVAGDALGEILAAASRAAADLVVLGMHRKSGFRDRFLGTTVERVLRNARPPVLVVKDEPEKPYRRLMVGIDFSACSRQALQWALRLVPGGEFHLVHAFTTPFSTILTDPSTHQRVADEHGQDLSRLIEEEMQAFIQRFPDHAERIKVSMVEGEVIDVLASEWHRIEPDLLVLGTHSRTGVAQRFLGSVAETSLANPPCDVLVVKGW